MSDAEAIFPRVLIVSTFCSTSTALFENARPIVAQFRRTVLVSLDWVCATPATEPKIAVNENRLVKIALVAFPKKTDAYQWY